jgi:hypothetical protein
LAAARPPPSRLKCLVDTAGILRTQRVILARPSRRITKIPAGGGTPGIAKRTLSGPVFAALV